MISNTAGSATAARQHIRTATLDVAMVALGLGKGRDRVLACDLTKEYVAINGDYRS
jgi:glutamate N-acetyltransferase/amino-acid N-acetyltransferase